MLQSEFVRFFRPDQAVKAVGDADYLPFVFEESRFDCRADDGVEAGGISTPGADADAVNVGHCLLLAAKLTPMILCGGVRVARLR